MKKQRAEFEEIYRTALSAYLNEGTGEHAGAAEAMGTQAAAAGLQTLDLAELHERTLVLTILPAFPTGKRRSVLKQAGRFFAAVIGGGGKREEKGTVHLEAVMATLSQRTVELAASNLELSREIKQRKTVETALRAKERSHTKSLEKSARLQLQLRRLSRQILSAQEEERKKISRELHDVIGGTLDGINIHLATLKKEAALTTQTLSRNIDRTQRLVEKSADIVNRFARELRPSVLDDLGLIPALHSSLKTFTENTGVRTRLTAVASVEKLDSTRRTVLFRVAQEALANVGRHAQATRVKLTIEEISSRIRMTIRDDGKSFNVDAATAARGRKRLGLLGMRERVEMVGGRFSVDSTPGHGTLITANIPRGRVPKPDTREAPQLPESV